MNCLSRFSWVVGVSVLIISAGAAQAARPESQNVQASLVADVDGVAAGRDFTLGVLLKMSPHWHTYWTNPGESGQATQIKLSGPAGLKFGEIQWPLPAKIEAPGGFSYGYEDSVLLMIPVTAAKDFAASSPADISADVSWLSCSGDQCVEGSAKLKIALSAATEARPANAGLFEQWRGKLPTPLDKTTGLEVTQKMSDKGPLPELELRWKQPPGKVEWYPETMPSIAIENVAVKHAGPTTTIAYKLTVFKSAEIGDGVVHGVVVYEDDKGRHGLRFPFRVAKEK